MGKTYLVRAILEEVNRDYETERQEDGITPIFYSAWVNCKRIYPMTKFKLHNAILEQIHKPLGPGHSDRDTTRRLEYLRDKAPIIVVLDEVDTVADLEKGTLLYDLMSMRFSLIMISNIFDWTKKADSRVRSRSQKNRLVFKKYSLDEMFKVLKFIRENGVKEGIMHDLVLKRIAEHTFDDLSGDVRNGKYLIYASVMEAMKEDAHGVTLKHVDDALKDVDMISLMEILAQFSKPELVVLASLVSVWYDYWKKKDK